MLGVFVRELFWFAMVMNRSQCFTPVLGVSVIELFCFAMVIKRSQVSLPGWAFRESAFLLSNSN